VTLLSDSAKTLWDLMDAKHVADWTLGDYTATHKPSGVCYLIKCGWCGFDSLHASHLSMPERFILWLRFKTLRDAWVERQLRQEASK
jgi:hypothetical protein